MKSLHFIYHELRPEPGRYTYVISTAEFTRHCELFRQLQQEASDESLRPEITFDDGYRSCVSIALPALLSAGLRAHFFITAGWTGQRAGYMDAAELRELHSAGMHVGAHGWSHKLLTACTREELSQELRGSRERLEDLLGSAVTAMSLPGGRANRGVLQACVESGYSRIFTSVPSPDDPNGASPTIGRLNLQGGATTVWLGDLLRPASGVLARLQRVDHIKTVAKRVLGDKLYEGLWSLANRHKPDPIEAGASSPS